MFEKGEEAFLKRDFARAVLFFENYLEGGPDRPRAAEAHLRLVLCRMALTPPADRTDRHLAELAPNLLGAARSRPLAAVLARCVAEDQRHRRTDPTPTQPPDPPPDPPPDQPPNWPPSWPPELVALADRAAVEVLSRADLSFLAGHRPAAHLGATWAGLSRHARRYRLVISDRENRRPDQRRKALVERYCAPPPIPPQVTAGHGTAGRVLTAAGGTAVLAAWPTDVLVKPWELGFALFFVLLAAGAAALLVGAVRWRCWKRADRSLRRYRDELAAHRDQPTDDQLDTWLRQDVERLVRYGAQRRLRTRETDLAGGAGGGDGGDGGDGAGRELDWPPQVLVGLSGLRRNHRYYPGAPEIAPSSVHDHRVAEAEAALATTVCRPDLDGRLRANRYDVLVLYPERDSFFLFRADLDLATGRMLTCSTQTLRYDTGITVYDRDVPVQRVPENPVTVWYDTGASRRQVFADHCFAITMPGQKVEIATGISRHRAGWRGRVTVAWPNQAAQHVIEQILWSRRRPPEPDTDTDEAG